MPKAEQRELASRLAGARKVLLKPEATMSAPASLKASMPPVVQGREISTGGWKMQMELEMVVSVPMWSK